MCPVADNMLLVLYIGNKIVASLLPVCCWIQRDTSRPWHKWMNSNAEIQSTCCPNKQLLPGNMLPGNILPWCNAALNSRALLQRSRYRGLWLCLLYFSTQHIYGVMACRNLHCTHSLHPLIVNQMESYNVMSTLNVDTAMSLKLSDWFTETENIIIIIIIIIINFMHQKSCEKFVTYSSYSVASFFSGQLNQLGWVGAY